MMHFYANLKHPQFRTLLVVREFLFTRPINMQISFLSIMHEIQFRIAMWMGNEWWWSLLNQLNFSVLAIVLRMRKKYFGRNSVTKHNFLYLTRQKRQWQTQTTNGILIMELKNYELFLISNMLPFDFGFDRFEHFGIDRFDMQSILYKHPIQWMDFFNHKNPVEKCYVEQKKQPKKKIKKKNERKIHNWEIEEPR